MNKRIIILVVVLCITQVVLCGCYEPDVYINGQTEHTIFYDSCGRIIQHTEFNRLTKLTTVYIYIYKERSEHDTTPTYAGVEMCTIDASGNIIDEYTKDTFLRYDKEYAD